MAIIMALLLVNVQPYTSASAASDKTIVKKLKKNSWTPLSNPDSGSSCWTYIRNDVKAPVPSKTYLY